MLRIKGKVEHTEEKIIALIYTGFIADEKGAFGSPSKMVSNFTVPWKGVATSSTPRCSSY